MPTETQVAKWGNSLAVRIPRGVIDQAHLAEGDRLKLDVTSDGSIVLRSSRPRYALDALVSGITPRNRHEAADWGPAVGRESW